jgi:predicted anti-sigma-YlaC factor YlaD
MTDVDCVTCREAVSARLDGEAEPVPAEQTDEHLASCVSCRSWQARAGESSRTMRVRRAPEVPDLADTVLEMAVLPPSVRGWWARIALVAVAAGQIGLAMSQFMGVGAPNEHGVAAGHLFNEGTAWNMALGIGLLWSALRTRATSGLIPVLGGFVVIIGIYSAHDLVAGAVSTSRVLGHGMLLLGLGLLVVINRWYNEPAPGPGQALDDPRADTDAGEKPEVADPEKPAGDTRRSGHLRPAGRHRAA